MKNMLLVIVLGLFLLSNTGCVSSMIHSNWKEAQQMKALRVEADGDQVVVAVNLSTLAYLKDNWPAALGAGIMDAGLAYGAYVALDTLTVNNNNNDERHNTIIVVNGDGNIITIYGDGTNTSTSN